MLEAVPGQGGVVDLEVELVLAGQVVPFEEAEHGGHVVVVLVLGRLLRLGLDQERTLEPDPVLVLGDQMKESGELVLLPAKVGVEQRLVALAAAPQHVVRPAQPMGRLEHRAHLGRGKGEHFGVWVGRCAGGIAGMAEQVGRAPQELQPGPLHVSGDRVDDRVKVGLGLGERAALGRYVPVVEAEERHAKLGQELERGRQAIAGRLHRLEPGVEPGPVERAQSEDIGSGPAERMPQAHADPEVIGHPLAEDQPIRLIDLEGEGVVRIEAAERNWAGDIGKEASVHPGTSTAPRSADTPSRAGRRSQGNFSHLDTGLRLLDGITNMR